MNYSDIDSQEVAVIRDGDANKWTIAMTRVTMERILKSGTGIEGDMIALWMFYAYVARWQGTLQPRATTGYTATGLSWSEERVRRAKSALIALELAADHVARGEKGKVIGHYVKLLRAPKTTLPLFQRVAQPESGFGGDKCLNHSHENAHTTLNGNTHTSEYSEEFETFWKAYPNKKAKQDAWKAWKKMKPKPTLSTIIAALKDQDPGWAKGKYSYVPHGATWINGRRWQDEVRNGAPEPEGGGF